MQLLWLEVQNNSPLAETAREAMERGAWLDDGVMAKLVITRLEQPDASTNGWVLVNFPQSVSQFQLLKDALKVPKLIY